MLDKKYTQWFPKITKDALEKYGECKIVKLFVGKHDIFDKFLRYTVMNVLSDGKWSKELIKRDMNKIMHTYIVCRVIYEEEEVDVMISKEFYLICNNYDDTKKKEKIKRELYELTNFDSKNIDINMNTLLEQTIKNIGDEKYFLWTPWSNCQDFSKDILVTIDALNFKHILLNKSVNIVRIYTDEAKAFTIQKLDAIFKEMPGRLHTFIDTYTESLKKIYNISL